MDTIPAKVASTVCQVTLEDLRFAELAARTGLEPELARRCGDDPLAVLAEFGLIAAEPLYVGGDELHEQVALLASFGLTAAEPCYVGSAVVIEDLDRVATAVLPSCAGTRAIHEPDAAPALAVWGATA